MPEKARGTYAGLASEASVQHLRELGVTAVELLPVHYHVDDRFLIEKGRVNYWGYNTLGFFAPDPRYATDPNPEATIREFKMMVRSLHAAGIEVILDVVYNHTAEGNQLGPTLSFRGIDNASYYRLAPDPRYYMDFTGCGNTFNMQHPQVLQLIMDSLRYWVMEMHVDGFRFDLASTLARELYEVDRLGAFFDIIHQDPILSQVKLIAEPWDVGPGGYQVGFFPVLWTEWNGKYRDNVRRFWKGDGGDGLRVRHPPGRLERPLPADRPGALTPASTSSPATTASRSRTSSPTTTSTTRPTARRTATAPATTTSWNCGAEGPTDNPVVLQLRERQKRNFLATLLLSQGVPMLLAGDEIGHTQKGNNNAYCQDNELTWLNWDLDERQQNFLEFTRKLSRIWREHPVFQRRKFFQGRALRGSDIKDISFLEPSGAEMSDEAWNGGFVKCLGVRLAGDLIGDVDERGEPIVDDTALILLNAHHEAIPFTLPPTREGQVWERVLDTTGKDDTPVSLRGGEVYEVADRSLALLFTREEPDAGQQASRTEIESLRREVRKPQPPVPSHRGSRHREE